MATDTLFASKPVLELLIAAPPRLLRGRRSGDPHRRTGDRETRRAGLCPPRDRPQSLRRRRIAPKGRDLRRGTGRGARRRPRRVFRARRSQIGARRGAGPRARLSRRDLPARFQGAPPGRTARRGGAAYRLHRPCRPSRGHRHLRPGACRRDVAHRDRRRCRGLHAGGSGEPRLPDADHLVGGRHRRGRGGVAASLPRDARSRRAARTSATPRRTARRR